jgi:hypothetical protein
MRLLRTLFEFAVNFCAAALLTNIISNQWQHVFPARTFSGMITREYLVSSFVTAALGFFAFYKWHSAPAKWYGSRVWCGSPWKRLLGRHNRIPCWIRGPA